MNPTRRFARFRQAGFTLMELMVGMAIGLLATIVIIQVMSVFEAQRRTTTGSADAQTNGGIALYSIAREVQMAGYRLLPVIDSALECTTHHLRRHGHYGGLTPVTITDGVAVAGVRRQRLDHHPLWQLPDGRRHRPTISQSARWSRTTTLGSNLGCQVGDIYADHTREPPAPCRG